MLMAILKIISWFCFLGGPWIAPFIAPFVNIGALLSAFIPILLSIMFASDASLLNSNLKEDGTREANWIKGSGFAFLIYYTICVIFMCIVMHITCNVSDQVNPL